MIKGVEIKKVIKHPTEEGFFAELVKKGEPSFQEVHQTSYAETRVGITKPFHSHPAYWEIWCVIKGAATIVLYDLRKDSPTFNVSQVITASATDMKVIAIPPGVAHTYRVEGNESLGMLYHAGKAYDPKNPGIEEYPLNSPSINFKWPK